MALADSGSLRRIHSSEVWTRQQARHRRRPIRRIAAGARDHRTRCRGTTPGFAAGGRRRFSSFTSHDALLGRRTCGFLCHRLMTHHVVANVDGGSKNPWHRRAHRSDDDTVRPRKTSPIWTVRVQLVAAPRGPNAPRTGRPIHVEVRAPHLRPRSPAAIWRGWRRFGALLPAEAFG